jgi:hypothetical protein
MKSESVKDQDFFFDVERITQPGGKKWVKLLC